MNIKDLQKALDNRPVYGRRGNCSNCQAFDDWFKDFGEKWDVFRQSLEKLQNDLNEANLLCELQASRISGLERFKKEHSLAVTVDLQKQAKSFGSMLENLETVCCNCKALNKQEFTFHCSQVKNLGECKLQQQLPEMVVSLDVVQQYLNGRVVIDRKKLELRKRKLMKWNPTTNRGQGIKDELLILIRDILGEDTRSLCLASLIPKQVFAEDFAAEPEGSTDKSFNSGAHEK